MRLRDIGKTTERREQNEPCNLGGMAAREVTRNSGAQRFAEQINWVIGSELLKSFVSGFLERMFARFTRAVCITGILNDEYIECGNLLECVCIMSAPNSAAGIAVQNKHASSGWLRGRRTFPADGFAASIGPPFQLCCGAEFICLRGIKMRWEINHAALKRTAANAAQQVKDRTD